MTLQHRTRIEGLLALFFERDDKWVEISEQCSSRGQGLCDLASEELVVFLHEQGVGASILWLDAHNYHLLKTAERYPDGAGGFDNEHCVALVEDHLIVDLTARQFDETLPFPYLWEVP